MKNLSHGIGSKQKIKQTKPADIHGSKGKIIKTFELEVEVNGGMGKKGGTHSPGV